MKLRPITLAMTATGLITSIGFELTIFAQNPFPSVTAQTVQTDKKTEGKIQELKEPKQIQKIEIIGSNIKRTKIETAAPIQILNREDIMRSGATTALEVLTSSPSVDVEFNSATTSLAKFSTGASSTSMRGLGKVATLVLVNGRRIAPYGLADGPQQLFTNLDAIAADAIERVEILKDGASAIYGSDAMAGVINIILRKDYEGGEIKGGYRYTEKNSKDRGRNVSFIYGYGDVDTNGFNTYLTVDAYKRDGYTRGDVRSEYPDWYRLTPGNSTWDAKTSASPTGNYFINSTNIIAAPGCPAGSIDPVDKLCKFDVLPYTAVTTDNQRVAVASNTHFKLGSQVNANVELTYAKAKNDYVMPSLSVNNGASTSRSIIWYDLNHGKVVGPFSYPKLPVGHPKNPYNFPVEYRARFVDTGSGFNFSRADSDQYRAMLALDGTLGNYDWKGAVGYMDSSARKSTRAPSAVGYTDAIVNAKYKFGGKNDPALLNAMFPTRAVDGHSKIAFADAILTGELARLSTGPVNFALGTDIRRESYDMHSSDNVLNGQLVDVFGVQVKDTRNQYAIFSEATLPLMKSLELTGALRADKTDKFKAHVSPKLGLRFEASDAWLLRATASGGFRAPNILESGNGRGRSSIEVGVNDLRRCSIAVELNNLVQNNPSATPIDKSLANGYRANDCNAALPNIVSANPNLKPETSRSITLGFVYAPSRQFSAALDFYNIERKDEIGARVVADVLKAEAKLPAGQLVRVDNSGPDAEFLALVQKYAPTNTTTFQGIGKLGLLYNPYVNSGKTRAKGFDFDLTARFKPYDAADLTVRLDGNYDWNYQIYSVTEQKWNRNVRGNYDGGSQFEGRLTTSLKTGHWDNSVIVTYASGYSNDSFDFPTYCASQKVAPEYMDVCRRVDPNWIANYSLSYSGIKNVRINFYVGNLFQNRGPITWRNPTAWSPTGFRTYYLSGSYKF